MPRRLVDSPLSEDAFFTDDSDLVEADRKRMALKAEAAFIEGEQKKIGSKIIATLKARNTKVIENGGWRTLLVSPSSIKTDWVALKQLLSAAQKRRILNRNLTLDVSSLTATQVSEIKRSIGLTKWKSCYSEAVDPSAVSQAVQDGLIDAELVASCSTNVPGTAYLKSTNVGA